jgi:hypothetical protein
VRLDAVIYIRLYIICCLNRLKEEVILYTIMSSKEAVIIDDVIYTVGDYSILLIILIIRIIAGKK